MKMDTKNKFMYKTSTGEIFDVEGAFKRHPVITPGKAGIDLWVESGRHNGLHFELRLSAGTMARLCQILNAAPVNGGPLGAIVNLKLNTTATSCEVEDIGYFHFDND